TRLPDGIAPVEGVLRVRGKSDLRERDDTPAKAEGFDLQVSALSGRGVPELAKAVRRRIVRDEDLEFEGRWPFDAGVGGPP
ncbi:MAG: hypothetical protein CMJ52_08940, partial [Planctomycetaceae bacterium]|nr:hypothetical protein [Planctomycetaceae bacterium]